MLAELIDDLRVVRLELQETNHILDETYHNCVAYCAGRGGCMLCPLKKDKAKLSIKNNAEKCKLIKLFPGK